MNFFKKLFNIEPSTVDGKINKVLEEKDSGLFSKYNSAEQAFKEIFKILNINIYNAPYSDFEKIADLGKAIFIRFDIMKMNEVHIVMAVKNKVHELFSKTIDDVKALEIIYLFKLPKIVKNFDLSKQEHRFLLKHTTNIDILKNLDKILLKNIINKMKFENYFSFENENEYFAFILNYKKKADMTYGNIHRNDNEYYFEAFVKAHNLAENGSHIGTISMLANAIDNNPVAIKGRFEIINSLLMIKELDIAKTILLDMSDYLVTAEDISLFYRRMGYIYIEKEIYDAAYYCMKLSLKYKNSDIAYQEIEYIREKSGIDFETSDIDYVPNKYDIPKLTAKSRKDLLSELNKVGVYFKDTSNEKEECPRYFMKAYNTIVEAIEGIFDDRNVKNEILPLLMIMSDLVSIEADLDRDEVFETQFQICEKLCSDSNCTEFINDRMNKYGEIIRSNKCRAEWNYNQYEHNGPFDIAITAFGDFICNPLCIEDYINAPFRGLGIDKRFAFTNVMLTFVYPTISQFCKNVEENFK